MKDLSVVFHVPFGEKIVLVLRRHPFVFLSEAALIILLMAVPLGGWFLVSHDWPDLLEGPVSRPALILLASAYLLLTWHFLIAKFVDYYLDLWVVTNKKILNVEQNGLFARTISELELDKIQDVTSEIDGILPTLLNFGDVSIQTAGEQEHFTFEQVKRPDLIREKILQLAEDLKRLKG